MEPEEWAAGGSGGEIAPAVDAGAREQAETRIYELPPVAEGWGWSVTFPDPKAQSGEPSHKTITYSPETLRDLLTTALDATDWPACREFERVVRVEAGREAHIRMGPIGHARFEAFLADTRWVPIWLGLDLAATELRDMLAQGTAEERGWSEHALRSGSRELTAHVEAQGRWSPRPDPDAPAASPGPASKPVAATFEIRCARHPNLMRDLGVDVRGIGITNSMAQPPHFRSGFAYLDDAQLEMFQRACARLNGPQHSERSLDLEAGERRVVDLGDGGRLTLAEVVLSASGKYLTLQYALREQTSQGLVFAPLRRTLTVPIGGTFVLHPADRLEPDSEATSDLYVAITVRAMAPSTQELVPLASSAMQWDPWDPR